MKPTWYLDKSAFKFIKPAIFGLKHLIALYFDLANMSGYKDRVFFYKIVATNP